MTSSLLKIIAIVTMLIDHIGAVFFPGHIILRYIGRISFPIFCFLLTEGFVYTKSRCKYALRLGLFALLSEVPHDLLFEGRAFGFFMQNIMFSLLLGLLALFIAEKMLKQNKIWVLALIPVLLLAQVLNLSYGAYGIALMVCFYVFRWQRALLPVSVLLCTLAYDYRYRPAGILVELRHYGFWLYGLVLLLCFCVCFYVRKRQTGLQQKDLLPLLAFICTATFALLGPVSTQMYAILALLPILLYTGKKGFYLPQYAAYWFYPLHLLVLYLLQGYVFV